MWLSTKTIYTERLSKKLDHKQIGLYRVTKLVKSSYQLYLPASMRIHNVFPLSLLRLAAKDLFPGQHNDLLPPVVVNNKKKWEVNNILNAKKHGRQVLFQVK